MKLQGHPLRFLTLTLLAALAAPLPALTRSVAPPAPAWLQNPDTHRAFREAFTKAQTLNATAEMQKLVKKNTAEAVAWILVTAETLSTNPDEEVADRMTALRKAWRAAIDTDFAENMEKYFSLMDALQKRERDKLKKRYDQANTKYWANVEKKDSQVYGLLSLELEGLGEAFETLGDYYYASQAWLLRSNCWEENIRGEDADLYKVCRSCKKASEDLAEIDLRDRSYIAAKARYDYLAAQGYDREAGVPGKDGEPGAPGKPGGGTGPPKGGVVKSGATTTVALGFEMVADVEAYERPCYYLDGLYNMWAAMNFREKGSKAKIVSLGKLGPDVIREGSAIIRVDLDGDGKGDVEIPLTGNTEPATFKVGEGEEEREWGLLARIGTEIDLYQNVQMNMSPLDELMVLYIAPGATVVGELNGVRLRIFDDNMDAVYGSAPLRWGHIGLSPGQFHPEMDSVVIGKQKRAVPFSEYMKIGDGWYILEPLKFGQELQATEVEVATGNVKLSFKGGKPSWVVLKGEGKYENCYFDITKGAEVPVGKYSLYYGELGKGKKLAKAKALILPGENMEKYVVREGQTTVVKLGGPFSFDFSFEEDEAQIHLSGKTVVAIGAAGERYERTWNCVPNPLVSWRKKGTKRGSKPIKTHVILEQDQFTEFGWAASWAPLDLDIKKKGHVEASELQLTEKKNKLLGKIVSEWKGN